MYDYCFFVMTFARQAADMTLMQCVQPFCVTAIGRIIADSDVKPDSLILDTPLPS